MNSCPRRKAEPFTGIQRKREELLQRSVVNDLIEGVEAVAVIRVLAIEAVVFLSRGRRGAAEDARDGAGGAWGIPTSHTWLEDDG